MDITFTPEELLSLVDPAPVPPSPSVYLEIPQTSCGSPDLVLPFIARILMEEDMDESFFYQYPDHPALLQAQQPFVEILQGQSGETARRVEPAASLQGGTGQDVQSLAFLDGSQEGNADQIQNRVSSNNEMLNLAFLKGVEEANKFLPRDSALQVSSTFTSGQARDNSGRSSSGMGRKGRHQDSDNPDEAMGRASKLMVPGLDDDDDARERFDKMMLNSHHIHLPAVDKLRVAMEAVTAEKSSSKPGRGRQQAGKKKEAVDLRTLLLCCANEVSTSNHRGARDLLRQIRRHASPTGDAAQRLAHFFAAGLEARLAGAGSQAYRSLMAKHTPAIEYLKGYELYMAACSFKRVAFTFSSMTIFDAAEGKTKLHIVDYGIQYGVQWPGLLYWLANREGGPPEVRITGVDLPQPGFRPAAKIEETGRRLSRCARQFGLPFEFRAVAKKWEAVRAEDLSVDPDEVLVVNDLFNFNTLMDESLVFDRPSPRDVVLAAVREMRPAVFIQGVVNGSSGPFFLARFREALFFFSSVFDMLDATVPPQSQQRLLLERDMFGPCILNTVACEGADRVERPETYKQWQLRNQRAGLRQLPLKPLIVKVATDKVVSLHHKDFVVDVDQSWLLQGWKGRILYAHSTWVPDDRSSDH